MYLFKRKILLLKLFVGMLLVDLSVKLLQLPMTMTLTFVKVTCRYTNTGRVVIKVFYCCIDISRPVFIMASKSHMIPKANDVEELEN